MEDGGSEQQKELNYHCKQTEDKCCFHLSLPVLKCLLLMWPERTHGNDSSCQNCCFITGFELIKAERGREFGPRQPETLCRPHQLQLMLQSMWSGLCLPHQLISSSKLLLLLCTSLVSFNPSHMLCLMPLPLPNNVGATKKDLKLLKLTLHLLFCFPFSVAPHHH